MRLLALKHVGDGDIHLAIAIETRRAGEMVDRFGARAAPLHARASGRTAVSRLPS